MLCLSASPYSWISFPQKPECQGVECICTPQFLSESIQLFVLHVFYQRASSFCPLQFGMGPRYAQRPTDLKAFLRPPKQIQSLYSHPDNFCISCGSVGSPHPSVSHHTLHIPYPHQPQHSPPRACPHCTTVPPNMVSEALAPDDRLSICIKIQFDNKLSRARTMLIFDLLIRYYVLNSQQITDFSFKLLCFPFLISDCKFSL